MSAIAFWPVWARIVLALAVAGGVVALAGPRATRLLAVWGQRQHIRDDAPARHRGKTGTPTMGGLLLLGGIAAASVLAGGSHPSVVLVLAAMLAFGAIGLWDDLLAVRRGRNLGLRARERLALQGLAGLGLGGLALRLGGGETAVWLPGLGAVDLGAGYPVFAGLLLVGFANAVNLTDGLDGLAAQLAAVAAVGLAVVAFAGGRVLTGIVAVAVAGACVGFLRQNAHPARLFMGDVGSNALGAGLAALALAAGAEAALFLIGGVFIVEAASVMLQVAYFKATGGRRLFRMSPLHHHFELSGWAEPAIVQRFTWAGVVCGAVGVLVMLR